MTDILKNIKDEDLVKLKDSFKVNWPYAIQQYMFLENWIEWKNKKKNVGIEFTAPDGDWSNGTFVAIMTEYSYNIMIFTLERPCTRLTNALQITKRIDWKRGPYFCAIHEDIDDECMKVLKNIGHPIDFDIPSTCWHIPKEIALKYETCCPNEYFTLALHPKETPKISRLWRYRFTNCEPYLSNIIILNGGIGVHDKLTKELCSWVTINDFGAVGIMQTADEHQRRKLGSFLAKELSKRRAKMGMDSIANVSQTNPPSLKLFKSIGAIKVCNIRWVQLKTPNITRSHL